MLAVSACAMDASWMCAAADDLSMPYNGPDLQLALRWNLHVARERLGFNAPEAPGHLSGHSSGHLSGVARVGVPRTDTRPADGQRNHRALVKGLCGVRTAPPPLPP
eukprot:352199-Chlamydomonas_euryale.AAC.14